MEEVDDATGFVRIVKLTLEEPAGTVTLAGTVAAAVLLLLVPTTVPDAETPVSVTVPVEEFPPSTLLGLIESEDSAAARTVSVAVRCVPLSAADITDVPSAVTGFVVTVKFAVLLPADTATFAPTCAAFTLLLVSATLTPPVGAGPVRVTVPVEELPPVTLVGFRLTVDGVGGFTIRFAVRTTPL